MRVVAPGLGNSSAHRLRRELGRAVAAAVVHDHDLVRPRREGPARGREVAQLALDGAGLVAAGNDDAQHQAGRSSWSSCGGARGAAGIAGPPPPRTAERCARRGLCRGAWRPACRPAAETRGRFGAHGDGRTMEGARRPRSRALAPPRSGDARSAVWPSGGRAARAGKGIGRSRNGSGSSVPRAPAGPAPPAPARSPGSGGCRARVQVAAVHDQLVAGGRPACGRGRALPRPRGAGARGARRPSRARCRW